jgi:hypothetical protein
MIVCADDYGLAEDIDEAILELVTERRLSAVSCMVLFERCTPGCLARLVPHQASMDLGLHFCLTQEDLPLSGGVGLVKHGRELPRFGELFRKALSRRLETSEIRAQLSAQYELFVAKMNREPDYIDGHLHVHQLPVVREAVVGFTGGLPSGSRPYVRNTQVPLRALWRRRLPWSKAALIGGFGKRIKQLLSGAGIRTNQGFAGIYDFAQWGRYPTYFPRFVDCLQGSNGILVVHPGKKEDWRRQEYETIRDFKFAEGLPRKFLVTANTEGRAA